MLFSAAFLFGAFALVQAERENGCSKPFDFPAPPGGPSKGIKIGERIVRISVPKNYSPTTPAPLIVAYHDKGMTAEEMEKVTRLSDSKLNPDYIVVYPEAVESKWISDDDADLTVDDKSFTANLIDGLTERLCIDKDRIHMTGLGTGGGLSHLMACDPFWSNNTASFALVNPAILAGLIMQRGVKDEITLLWEKCKPARVPVKLLEIHGENNTLNSYWGKSVAKRGRLPTVQWLVEWAMRNGCGEARGMPGKGNENDQLYKTDLTSGTIYEGAVHANKLQRAMYRCYALTPEEQVEKYIGTFQVIDKEAAKMVPLDKDGKEEKPGDRGDIILEHLFVKNYGHGWPRIAMKDGTTETFETAEKEETPDAPVFDATREVLKWFSQHKLSDESHAPGVAMNVEPVLDDAAIAKLVAGITAQVDKQKKIIKENEDTIEDLAEALSRDNEETEQDGGNVEEEKSELADRIKDEL